MTESLEPRRQLSTAQYRRMCAVRIRLSLFFMAIVVALALATLWAKVYDPPLSQQRIVAAVIATLAVLGALANAVFYFRGLGWRCPRCGEEFASVWWWSRTTCESCGASIFELD